ncbi:MAG: hypothetical protein HY674_21550 [Chloroflexi bacterium]|nr:hypothetical protein [Chloroflexota bacterium]
MKTTKRSQDNAHPARPLPFCLLIVIVILLLISTAPGHALGLRFGQTGGQPSKLTFTKLPLGFEANEGQADPSVKFLSRGKGCALFLGPSKVMLQLGTGPAHETNRPARATLRMKFAGANSLPALKGVGELPGKVNYLIGSDPSRWRANVATFAKVKYEGIYPGIDVVF